MAIAAALALLIARRPEPALGFGLAGGVVALIGVDYLWSPVATARLPDGQVVAQVTREASVLRPWSMIAPTPVGLVVVVTSDAVSHGDTANERIVPLRFVGRGTPELTVPVLFDCLGLRQVPITAETLRNSDGTVVSPAWQPVDETDVILQTACGAELP